MKRFLFVAGGYLLSLAGIVFVVMYIKEAVIDRFGEGDQSLLFWYLPVLFIGMAMLLGGLLLLRKYKNMEQ